MNKMTKRNKMILMDEIIDEYHENIRKKSAPVTLPLSEEDGQTLDRMMEFVHNSIDDEIAEKYELRPSVGIAAPQINILKRLSAISFINEHDEEIEVELINPRLVRHSTFLSYLPGGEGCLSVLREVEGIVPRYERITIVNHDREGNEVRQTFTGYAAIVVQHEMDHLDGIIFVDKINYQQPYAAPENSRPIVFPGESETTE